MGRSKAALHFGPATLLDRVVAELRREFRDIIVAAAPEATDPLPGGIPGARVLRDATPYAGPMPALEQALGAARCEIAFACSCDLPMVNAAVARELCRMMEDCDAVVPRTGGRLQVLHAAYRKRCAGMFARMGLRGEQQIRGIVRLVKVRVLEESEVRRLDPELLSFLNVNTPADYEHALKLSGLG